VWRAIGQRRTASRALTVSSFFQTALLARGKDSFKIGKISRKSLLNIGKPASWLNGRGLNLGTVTFDYAQHGVLAQIQLPTDLAI
jgi:hypothetical protein